MDSEKNENRDFPQYDYEDFLHIIDELDRATHKISNWRDLDVVGLMNSEVVLCSKKEYIDLEKYAICRQADNIEYYLNDYYRLVRLVMEYLREINPKTLTELNDFILKIGKSEDYFLKIGEEIDNLAINALKKLNYCYHLAIATRDSKSIQSSQRGKNKKNDPAQEKAIEEAISVWSRSPKLSLDDVAFKIKEKNIARKSHSQIKKWIAPYNPKSKSNKLKGVL